MRPYTEERDVHFAKGVAPGVRGLQDAGTYLKMSAAEIERDANKRYYDQQQHLATLKLQANQSAMLQQQRLNEDRDREVNARLAQIEDLNTQARGKPEDTWGSPIIFGRLMGALLFGLGGAVMAANKGRNVGAGMGLMLSGKFVDGLINQDINHKLGERAAAGQQAKAQTDLLHLHMENLGSEAKAIEATKLAYYDSVLHQMEIVNAEHAGNINEAKYKNLQDQILNLKADQMQKLHVDMTDDEHVKQVNKMRDPVVSGGSGAKVAGHLITLSDGTTYAVDSAEGAAVVRKELAYRQKLEAKYTQIVELRTKLRDLNPITDRTAFNTGVQLLKKYDDDVANIDSVANSQGVNTKSDTDRRKSFGTPATAGFDTIESAMHPITGVITDQTRTVGDNVFRVLKKDQNDQQKDLLATYNGQIQKTGVNKDPVTGNITRVTEDTGRTATPTERLAPKGAVAKEKGAVLPTADTPVKETATEEPVLSREHPAVEAAKRRKKEHEKK
jgi:hypothetical protein